MKPVILGVAGGTGSGKTTVVQALVEALGCESAAVIEQDSYYRDRSGLSNAERENINYDHPDSLENELLAEHLKELREGRPVQVPIYDFFTHTRRVETRTVEPQRVIVLEGILILNDRALRELMDIRIFVDTDDDVRFIRRLVRDIRERSRTMESVIRQYLETVKPMHRDFVEPSKRYADLIIPEGGENRIAIDILLAKIRSLL